VSTCPRIGCQAEVPEDTVWLFRGEFYCSETCASGESFRLDPMTPRPLLNPSHQSRYR
jgi:hypothetical protein